MDLLVVCTGNICRSPMAAALLRRRFTERAVTASVSSAGIVAEGRPPSSSAVDVMAELGLDITDHRSSLLTAERVEAADLVLAMAREHLREAVVLVPAAFPKTFTLKELVRRAGAVGSRADDEPIADWLARVGNGREPARHLGASPDDDIADPIGQRMAAYERTADELVVLVDALTDLLWQPTAEHGAPPLAAT